MRGERKEMKQLRLQEGRTEMPTEKFSKCGSLICGENFLPYLLINSSLKSTLYPLKTNCPPLLVSDLIL